MEAEVLVLVLQSVGLESTLKQRYNDKEQEMCSVTTIFPCSACPLPDSLISATRPGATSSMVGCSVPECRELCLIYSQQGGHLLFANLTTSAPCQFFFITAPDIPWTASVTPARSSSWKSWAREHMRQYVRLR